MFLMSLLRLSGVVILLIFLMVTIVMGAGGGIVAGLLPGAVVLVGLWMAVAGDRGMDRYKAKKAQIQKREALAFNASTLKVGLRWFRWLVMVLLLGGLFWFGAFIGVVETWRVHKYVPFFIICFLVLLVGIALSGLLALGWQTVKAGHLLHLDSSGFAHASLPVIPWREVLGVDIREMEIKGVKQSYLVLALRRNTWAVLRSVGWRRMLYWMAPQMDAEQPLLVMHCNWTSIPAATLLEATKKIADSAGAPRIKNWNQYESIETAMRRQALSEKAEQADQHATLLFQKMQRLSKSSAVSTDEVKALETELQQAMNRVSSAREAQFEEITTNLESNLKKVKRSLRWIYLGWGVVIVMIGMPFLYKWLK